MAKQNRFTASFKRADEAFNEQYKEELAQLKGLSEDQIASIAPGLAGKEAYTTLVNVVEKASMENTAKAELFNNIKAGGALVAKLARGFIPGFV